MPTNRRLTAATSIAVLAVGVPAASYAASQTRSAATHHGTVHVWVSASNTATNRILLTGLIGDYGTATSETQAGKVDKNGSYVHIVLKHGTFLVNAVAFNKKANALTPQFDKQTCTYWGTVSGPVTLSDGTGAYAGITGTIRITVSFAALGPLSKGKCNLSPTAKPRDVFNGQITGSGSVTY